MDLSFIKKKSDIEDKTLAIFQDNSEDLWHPLNMLHLENLLTPSIFHLNTKEQDSLIIMCKYFNKIVIMVLTFSISMDNNIIFWDSSARRINN